MSLEDREYVDRFTSVQLMNHALYVPSKGSKKLYEICNEVDIEKIQMDIITGEMKVHLKFWVNSEYQKLVIDRKDLTGNRLVSVLPSRGIQVTEKTVHLILDYLLYREKRVKVEYVHNHIGFWSIKGEKVYLHYNAHSRSMKVKSLYCGDLLLCPKGTLDGELQVISDHVIGHTPLELAWILGFSAPLTSYLRNMISLDNIIVHSYGRSSSGKSSSSLLSISPFGAPLKTATNSLFGTWMSTPNALISRLSCNQGLPVVYDEASVQDSKVYSKVIYQMSAGFDKARLTSDSKLRDKQSWSTTVISNAENAIITNDNMNQGLRVRVLSLKNIEWTVSAKQSEIITEKIMDNYGNSGIVFVQKLLSMEESDLLKMFTKCKEEVLASLKKRDVFSNRAADKLAIIYLSAILVEGLFKLKLDTIGILNILTTADEDQLEGRDLGLQAYLYIREQATSNLNKFIFKDSGSNLPFFSKGDYSDLPNNEIMGKVVMGSDKKPQELWILRSSLDKILKTGGFTDADVILHEFRDKGIIETDRGKFTKKRALYKNGDAVRVVIIKLRDNVYELNTEDADEENCVADELERYRLSKETDEIIVDDIV